MTGQVVSGTLAASRWPMLALTMGLALGGAAAFNSRMAVALAIVAGIAAAIGVRPPVVLAVLGASFYVEHITIGGATIGRFIGATALVLVLAEAARGRAILAAHGPFLWACAYGAWALASALWTESDVLTTFFLGSLAVSGAYMLAFAMLVRSREDLHRALIAISVAAVASGFASIVLFASGGGSRTEGLTGDPNFFAAYQVFAFPLMLALAAVVTTAWLRWALLAGTVAVIGSVFTSLSRGGILTLALVAFVLLVVPRRSIFRSFGQKWVATAVVALGVSLALAVSYTELTGRITSLVQGEEAAGSGRVNEWRAAWSSSQQNPVLGVGFGAFPAVSNELVRRTPGADLRRFDLREGGVHVHNTYLGSLAELGLVGLTLYLGLLVSTGRLLRRTAVRARRLGDLDLARIANALLVSLVGWSVATVFLSGETARPLWIAVGIALALPKLLPDPRRATAPA